MQLPTLILEQLDFFHTYFMLLYNQFNNELSWAAKGEIYPELAGQNFPEKVAEIWGQWYLEPKIKYQFMKRFERVLPQFLPIPEVHHTQVLTQEGMEFERFANPEIVLGEKLDQIISTYQETKERDIPYYKIEDTRSEMLQIVRE